MEFNATFIVSAISFIAFTLIMNAIFYKPLQKTVSERQTFVDDTLKEAKEHAAKTEAIIKDKAKKLESTKQEAKKTILAKTEEVKTQKSDMTSRAQQKSVQKIEFAKAELQKTKEDLEGALSEEAKKLAQDITSKILGKV